MGDLLAFQPWPKIPRLSKPMVVTEKIDGTNAAVVVRSLAEAHPTGALHEINVMTDDGPCAVYAQSRKRIIQPGDDNYGFAAWVWEHAGILAAGLGPGRHFGEWWGAGVNRGYGLSERRFSPFNTHRWNELSIKGAGLDEIGVTPIPVLAHCGRFDTVVVDHAIQHLEENGSQAAPGFMNPEGVVVFHSASGQLYKRLIEGDDVPKSLDRAA